MQTMNDHHREVQLERGVCDVPPNQESACNPWQTSKRTTLHRHD